MKTTLTLAYKLLILSLFILHNNANAQFTHFPTEGAPIFGKAPVAKGNLDNLDKHIWVKVNGNMVGPQPHNKMHPYVTPGSAVDVNFNVNKAGNRYTLVSYSVHPDGRRLIYDYQSNFYNATKPVRGNSNQQLCLTPTCQFEIYFVKGTLVTEFMGTPPAGIYDPATDLNNPYTNGANGNVLIDYAYGGTGTCEDCPVVINTTDCVYPRLLEVIDLPGTQEKELIFSIINNINTNSNACGTDWPQIGDILFTNINPSHTGNNQPYQFRYNYQLGPHIPSYPLTGVTPPLPNNYQGSFVFDQRNNHNVLDFDVYQSEIVRFKVSYAEYARLSSPTNTVIPQICVELSTKHPEPHQTLPPVYCADIDFVCEPPVEEVCVADSSSNFIVQVPYEFENDVNGNFQVPLRIVNLTGTPVSEADITLGPAPYPILAPLTGPYDAGNYTWNVVNDGISNVTFTSINTAGFINGNSETFMLTVDMDDLMNSGGLFTIEITAGGITETLELTAAECAIIVPLPVELTSFTGKTTSEGVALHWNTASEQNNDHFLAERSTDGQNFESIGRVAGHGNTNTPINYEYTDKTAPAMLVYYRLKQVDYDGKTAYSRIITVENSHGANSNFTVTLVPNPCHNQQCSVQISTSRTSNPTTIELQDLAGRTVFSKQLPASQTTFEMPRTEQRAGIYILSARSGKYFAHQKVIIP